MRTVYRRRAVSGRRTHRRTVTQLRRIGLLPDSKMLHRRVLTASPRLRRTGLTRTVTRHRRTVLGHCPRRLSNNRVRQIVVTVTVSNGPSLLVTSRPAATLSIAIRTAVLSLLHRLHSHENVSLVFVARSLKVVTRVTSRITIVCRNRVIRANSI